MKKFTKSIVFTLVSLMILSSIGMMFTVSAATTADGIVYTKTANNTITITGYNGTATDLVIPEEIESCPVTATSNGALKNANVKSVTFPTTFTNLGANTFFGHATLEAVTFLAPLTVIGGEAFRQCQKLERVEIVLSNATVANGVFRESPMLKEVILTGTVISFGDTMFGGSAALEKVILPDGITKIGDHTFNGCFSLLEIDIPDTVTSIGSCAFLYAESLTSVVIPEGVVELGERAFHNCPNLTDIYLPESLENIGNNAIGTKDNADHSGIEKVENIKIFYEGDNPVINDYVEEKGISLNPVLKIDKNECILAPGSSVALNAYAEDVESLDLAWTSNNPAVATVDENGVVTAVANGDAIIVASAQIGAGDPSTVACKIIVGELILDKSLLAIKNGTTAILNANVGSAKNLAVVWESNNEDVATVDENGVVTAVGKGVAVITATFIAADGSVLTASGDVIVANIVLDKKTYSLNVNMRVTLEATLDIDYDGDLPIVWKSSDTNVALVDQNGVVTAIRQGEVTITATISGTKISDSCTIYIGQAEKTQSIIDGILEFFRMIFEFLGGLFTGGSL